MVIGNVEIGNGHGPSGPPYNSEERAYSRDKNTCAGTCTEYGREGAYLHESSVLVIMSYKPPRILNKIIGYRIKAHNYVVDVRRVVCGALLNVV